MMKMLALFVAGIVTCQLSGCANIAQVGDRIEVVEKATAHPTLRDLDLAMYYGGTRGDIVEINQMLQRGQIFDVEPGTTGEIISFPRPSYMSRYDGNMNDDLHWVAYVRLDDPPRMVVMNISKGVRITRPKDPGD